ncbi:hypothetical protein AVEN_206887-1 [Araneus ventricosus]|uniref:Uncharacterized protein n=1 Tax=Araneus ventricosus TaxID=182803 RepID=A0A4Y2PZC9_ARAVE|nr:hypothetical protein AVEN_206887-1 [Araneus ventricosus]
MSPHRQPSSTASFESSKASVSTVPHYFALSTKRHGYSAVVPVSHIDLSTWRVVSFSTLPALKSHPCRCRVAFPFFPPVLFLLRSGGPPLVTPDSQDTIPSARLFRDNFVGVCDHVFW